MQISTKHISDTELKLTIVANTAELQAQKDHVLAHFQKRVKIAGFREGKAPLALVEKQIDSSALQSEFLEEAVNQMYVKAVNEKQLRPVDNPNVTLKKFVPFTDLEFEAEVQVVGEIQLADYKKIKKTKQDVKITAEDVKEVLKSLQQRVADKKDVRRAAKTSDVVWIDFVGNNAEGKPVEGAEGKDYPLTLGSNTFIPGFEDNVIGMKPGDEKTFTLKFPKDYNAAALANKKVTFTVTATKVQEVIEPKLDDEFAAKTGPFKTLQELKDDIKKQLKIERSTEADRQFENELIQEIANKSQAAIPKVLVDEQIKRIEQEEKQNLVYRGQTWQEHLSAEGVTEEQHFEQKRPAAEERVKGSLVLAEIAGVEKLEVTDDELDLRMKLLKGKYQEQTMQAELDKPEARRDIASRILTEKTIAKLVEYATSSS